MASTPAPRACYSATKLSLASSIGQPMGAELDRGVRKTLAAMLQTYLRSPIA